MWIYHDPDEWETVIKNESYGTLWGVPMGSCSMGYRRRTLEEVAKIKAEKVAAYDKAILVEAEMIRRKYENVDGSP